MAASATARIEDLPYLASDTPEFWDDPVANYAAARGEAMVYRNSEGLEILGYEAHQRVLRSRQFHSDHGLMLQRAGITHPDVIRFRTEFLVGTRGAERVRLRTAAAEYFGPAGVVKMQDGIRRVIRRVLAEADTGEPVDFAKAVTFRIPTLVYMMLIDVPDEDEEFIARVSDDALKVFQGDPAIKDRVESAYLELFAYVENQMERRRRNPGNDLVSHFVGLVDEGQMSHQEAADLIALTLEASVDTTGNTMTSMVGTLLSNLDQWKLLVEDPDGMRTRARDEALRMFPAVLRNRRVASEDLQFEGVEIPQGTTLFAPNLAAGRDPEVFPDPNRYDLQRENPRPFMSFGGGMQACLGQNVARMDIDELLLELATSYPNARLAAPFALEYHPPSFGSTKRTMVVLR